MIRPRHYWVVSPNVMHDENKGWKQEILNNHVAIMGWGPDEYNSGYGRGPQFAGIGNPSVQQGDVILIAKGHTHIVSVAIGLVDSEYWQQRFPLLTSKPVYLRHLEPFNQLPNTLPNLLNRILPWQSALSEIPQNPVGNKARAWIDQQLKQSVTKVSKTQGGGGFPRQPDIQRRQAVEKAAQDAVEQHYKKQNYRIDDVSGRKCGWDLEATKNGYTLNIEVKGLFGVTPLVELTPNEYIPIKNMDRTYRLCVVTNALDNSKRRIQEFSFKSKSQGWMDANSNVLNIDVRESARIRA
jgi:Domain of unknown function (DUF3883)